MNRGTSPYFVRNNRERVKQAIKQGEVRREKTVESINSAYSLKDINISLSKTDQLQAINIPLSVFNNKNEFRALQQEVRQELKNVGNVQIVNKNLYTSRLFFGKNERRSVVAHCFDADEIAVVRNLPHLFNTLNDGRYEPINMARSNYREKMKSGIRNYVVYNIEINGIIYELKCVVKAQKSIKHGSMIEYPYSLKKKKMRNNKVA